MKEANTSESVCNPKEKVNLKASKIYNYNPGHKFKTQDLSSADSESMVECHPPSV